MRNLNANHSGAVRRAGVHAARGFTLIEMLVALVVLSVGLLGLAALQSRATQFNTSAYLRSQATILAYDIADRIRANRQAALTGAYTSAYPVAPPTCAGAVAAGTVAQQDLDFWRRSLACALPGGNGEVNFVGNMEGGVLTIRVRWDESRDPTTPAPEQFEMTTGL